MTIREELVSPEFYPGDGRGWPMAPHCQVIRLPWAAAVRSFALLATLALHAIHVRAATPVQAFTDNIAYNAGSVVQIKVIYANSPLSDINATVRYDGDSKAVLNQRPVANAALSSHHPAGYSPLWQIPTD